jgi:hypothetical protein
LPTALNFKAYHGGFYSKHRVWTHKNAFTPNGLQSGVNALECSCHLNYIKHVNLHRFKPHALNQKNCAKNQKPHARESKTCGLNQKPWAGDQIACAIGFEITSFETKKESATC